MTIKRIIIFEKYLLKNDNQDNLRDKNIKFIIYI